MGKNKAKDETLGVFGLVALIIGSTIGTGVFTTAVNMAADGVHTGAVLSSRDRNVYAYDGFFRSE